MIFYLVPPRCFIEEMIERTKSGAMKWNEFRPQVYSSEYHSATYTLERGHRRWSLVVLQWGFPPTEIFYGFPDEFLSSIRKTTYGYLRCRLIRTMK
jgi:hypothetical protein